MQSMQYITALYAGICGLLLVAFAVRVSLTRGQQKVDLGDGGKDPMLRAIRVHGNAAEYVPITLFLMLLLEMQGSHHWFLHVAGITLIVSRLLHAQGLMQSRMLTPGRLVGTGLGWTLIGVLSIDCFFGFV
jgi:uncharacterized membrane protein YecN with MAPEG domain